MYHELIAAELMGEAVSVSLECVRGALALVRDALEDDSVNPRSSNYRVSIIHEGANGRPRFDIPWNLLECLLEVRFTVPQIAGTLGVSVRTVRRQMFSVSIPITLTVNWTQLWVRSRLSFQPVVTGKCKATSLYEEYESSRGEFVSLNCELILRALY